MKTVLSLIIALVAFPALAEDVAAGRSLYQEYCASCHGDRLQGEPNWQTRKPDGTMPAPPHDATGHTWHHGDKLLFNYTRLGGEAFMEQQGMTGFKSGMPAFGDSLTDDEIRDILAFIKRTWPRKIRDAQAARSAAER